MSRATASVLGFVGGTCVGLLLAIAYDTSAQVATLEGGRRHLLFRTILLVAVVVGAIGAGVGNTLADQANRRRRH